MEGHEYTLIQQAREQNRERKKIQREIKRLNSGGKLDVNNLTDQERAIHQFDDDNGLCHIEKQKATLEARNRELMVHVPMSVNTVSETRTGSKLHGAKLQFYDQQQLYLQKKKLRIVVVILCAAIVFGNQFVGNGPAPLQTEIQQHMNISDAQFNMYFSIKFFASLIPPLILALIMDGLTLRSILLSISVCCTIGQMFFAIGLQDKDHMLCVLGRFMIGISDSLSIFQQSLMCVWFPASQLPFAFGILLFLQKIVRTSNDNLASMFYVATAGNLEEGEVAAHSLVMYQWIGFAVCILSTICSLLLAEIHESVIESNPNSEVKEKKKELQRQSKDNITEEEEDQEDKDDGKEASIRQLLTRPVILFMLINAFGYASIHAFYPNLSKFMQTKYNFSNVQAGSISSLPYLIASLTVPFLGSMSGYLGETYFELMLFGSIAMVLGVHLCYLSISDVTNEGQVGGWSTVLPLIPFGLGHALFTTMQAPTVPKLVKNKKHLPRVFTYVKITESMGITLFVYLAGVVRQNTGSFTGVIMMLIVCSAISMAASFVLIQESKDSVGLKLLNCAKVKENIMMIKSYARKFISAQPIGHKTAPGSPTKSAVKHSSSDSDSSPKKQANTSGKDIDQDEKV